MKFYATKGNILAGSDQEFSKKIFKDHSTYLITYICAYMYFEILKGRKGTILRLALWALSRYRGYGCFCGASHYSGNYVDETDRWVLNLSQCIAVGVTAPFSFSTRSSSFSCRAFLTYDTALSVDFWTIFKSLSACFRSRRAVLTSSYVLVTYYCNHCSFSSVRTFSLLSAMSCLLRVSFSHLTFAFSSSVSWPLESLTKSCFMLWLDLVLYLGGASSRGTI